jgi:outer membrane protein assembly factor BamB
MVSRLRARMSIPRSRAESGGGIPTIFEMSGKIDARMKLSPIAASALLVSAVLAGRLSAQTRLTDWPQWRGPNRDGAIASFTEPNPWPDTLTRKWKVDVGLGYATPVVIGNRVYMFARQGDEESLGALDADTGKVLWRATYPAAFTISPAAARHEKGPKSTPTFADGKLFTLGMTGIVSAFDAATGKRLWQTPASQPGPLYHTSMSPLVDRGLAIVHVGSHGRGALTAFDVNSGAVKWRWDGDGPGYGSPIVAEFDGTRQIITFTQDNLVGVSASTGALLWERRFETNYTQNCITPVLYGQTVIVSGLDKGVTAFKLVKANGQWNPVDVWENTEVSMYMTNGVIVHDTFVALSHKNSGQFFALDARTGKTVWKSAPRQATNAAISRAGDLLFILKDDAELLIARSGAKGLETVKTYAVADSATWSAPAVSGRRLFVKDVGTLTLWTMD